MVCPDVSFKEKFSWRKGTTLFKKKVERNAAFSRLLIAISVTTFRILTKCIGTVFLIFEILKNLYLILSLKARPFQQILGQSKMEH